MALYTLLCDEASDIVIQVLLRTLPASVQIVLQENTCVEHLSDQARHMKADGLLRLAKLADHWDLSSLLETAADYLITLPMV